MGTLLLIDGNSLTYRAFFALPTDMATASGQVTNAVFGFTSMLINLIKDHHPDGIVVAFDRPEPTFRHVALPSYKAQREAAPDILRQQMGLVREVVAALGIRSVDIQGFEADDIIATLCEQAKARDAGALAYLVKPFQKSDLIPAIEVAIGRFREMQAISGERDKLEEQLETRKAIDRAKGILMDEVGMKEQEAFAFIQRTAMSERTKMRDVADRIITKGLRPN